MLRVLPVIIALALVVYAIVDCLQSDPREVRNLPRLGWLALIVLIPVLGAVAWLLSGRPRAEGRPGEGGSGGSGPGGGSGGSGGGGPIGPDDDPDFLRRIRPNDP